MRYIDCVMPCFEDRVSGLYLCNTFLAIEHMQAESIDIIFVDPLQKTYKKL